MPWLVHYFLCYGFLYGSHLERLAFHGWRGTIDQIASNDHNEIVEKTKGHEGNRRGRSHLNELALNM